MTSPTPQARAAGRLAGALRVVSRQARAIVLHILLDDAGGIDDAALPSGFLAPYQRGSRGVRNLWHIPF